MSSRLKVRDIVLVDFPIHTPNGREQQGLRPAIIVALPRETGLIRFSLIVVVPMTTTSGDWARQNPILYPILPAGIASLKRDSTVLLDQIRALDVRRILRYRGSLTAEEYQPIEDGLTAMFEFAKQQKQRYQALVELLRERGIDPEEL